MADSDQLLQRNKDLEATCAHEAAAIIAGYQAIVITRLDPRTAPSAFLEPDLCDAMAVRNAGGRVLVGALKDLAYVGCLASALVAGGPHFEAAVVHHTQRGTRFLADDSSAGASLTSSAPTTRPWPAKPSPVPVRPSTPTSSSCAQPSSCRTR